MTKYRRPDPGSTLAVWTVSTDKRGSVKKATEFVDMTTGEIVPAESGSMPVLDLRDKIARQGAALGKLRPEVLEFAYFVLAFRNRRRGITPGVNTLCRWYGELTGKRADNVRRYVSKLEQAGILAGESLLCPLFQLSGGAARSHLGEDDRAYVKFLTKYKTGWYGPLRRRDGHSAPPVPREFGGTRPGWMSDAEPTGNLMTHEIYCDLMRRVRLPITHTAHEVACSHADLDPVEPCQLQGACFRERVDGLSADDVNLLISAYLGQRQRSRLHDA